MGLMYVFPVSREEVDFVLEQDKVLTLKTYGLPYVFWIYALCIVSVIAFMFLAIQAPILKLIELGDATDASLGYSLLGVIGLMPLLVFGFFFYEKRLVRQGKDLRTEHRVFGVKVLTSTYHLETADQLSVEPFLSSPNMARIKNEDESSGFQNKGYFVLWLQVGNKKIQLDRHSRKVDLEKLKNLLTHI